MKNGKWKMGRSGRRLLLCLSTCHLPVAICHLSGCASNGQPTTRPSTPEERQEAALRDPMNYKAPRGGDISGGDISSFDKEGFKRDLNHVFNP